MKYLLIIGVIVVANGAVLYDKDKDLHWVALLAVGVGSALLGVFAKAALA